MSKTYTPKCETCEQKECTFIQSEKDCLCCICLEKKGLTGLTMCQACTKRANTLEAAEVDESDVPIQHDVLTTVCLRCDEPNPFVRSDIPLCATCFPLFMQEKKPIYARLFCPFCGSVGSVQFTSLDEYMENFFCSSCFKLFGLSYELFTALADEPT